MKFYLAISGLLGAFGWLVAEGNVPDPLTDPTLVKLLVAAVMSLSGLMVWYVRYNVTTTLPNIVKEFREESAAQRTAHAAEQERQRGQCREEQAEIMKRFDRLLEMKSILPYTPQGT